MLVVGETWETLMMLSALQVCKGSIHQPTKFINERIQKAEIEIEDYGPVYSR